MVISRSGVRNRKMSESSTESHIREGLKPDSSSTDSDLDRIELERMPLKIVDRAMYDDICRVDSFQTAVTTSGSTITIAPNMSQGRNIVKRPRAIIPKPKQNLEPLSASDYLDNYFDNREPPPQPENTNQNRPITVQTSAVSRAPQPASVPSSSSQVRYVLSASTVVRHKSESNVASAPEPEQPQERVPEPKYAMTFENQLIPIQYVIPNTIVKSNNEYKMTSLMGQPGQTIKMENRPAFFRADEVNGQLSDWSCSSSRSCSSSSSSGIGSFFGSDTGESQSKQSQHSDEKKNFHSSVKLVQNGRQFKLKLPVDNKLM
jgi:hypothetical protein